MSAAEDRLNDPFQTAPAATVTVPRTVTGRVTDTGAITAGTGFTVNKSATGTYDVTFTSAFSAVPTVMATVGDTAAGRAIKVNTPATTGFTVKISNVAGAPTNEDQPFNFVAFETA
jgi:hypothetical protein